MVDIQKARENLEKRAEIRRSRNLKLHAAAVEDSKRIIEMIAADYKPRWIIQWGSVLDSRNFNSYSDIDIAVEGITEAETFFRLLGDAMAMTSFPLHIVQIEKIEPEYAESILERGKVVYERQ